MFILLGVGPGGETHYFLHIFFKPARFQQTIFLRPVKYLPGTGIRISKKVIHPDIVIRSFWMDELLRISPVVGSALMMVSVTL